MKYSLHPGATSALLKVDGTTMVENAVPRSFPCPNDADAGLSCFDVTMPETEAGHVFHAVLIENPGGMVTSIAVPANAAQWSRWHPLAAPSLLGVIFLAMIGSAYYGLWSRQTWRRWWRRRRRRVKP
jgi:hypothetical protein